MPAPNKNFGLGCSVFMMAIGLSNVVWSLVALKNGTTVSFGAKSIVQVSPWYTLVFGTGVAGLIRAWKDRNKFPF